ncbi:hypothetical protein SISNIDRAFT_461050 [Sistotremastrum niveocremeum HHB9708]|uniref:Uncharacterized protein n=2 Tax=Sistotremastraceae TaxID=3402574 RepID=A0A164N3L6_9AGAM|nr:hypothetical protein SISNIDRAFT_461050 [Sistotremastrum niveocremeum HHB9708]KZT33776.1 hypothetical protein SISSUDRAFT_1065866 [Sistotremastrum suecicum HHB10207 ss-3]
MPISFAGAKLKAGNGGNGWTGGRGGNIGSNSSGHVRQNFSHAQVDAGHGGSGSGWGAGGEGGHLASGNKGKLDINFDDATASTSPPSFPLPFPFLLLSLSHPSILLASPPSLLTSFYASWSLYGMK